MTALWGDSHVDQIVTPLANEFNKYGYAIKEFSIAGCPPILDIESTVNRKNCAENNRLILTYLLHNKKIKHVFLHAYWIRYMDQGLINDTLKSGKKLQRIKLSFKTVIQSLIHAGKVVHLIYPIPKMRVDPPLYLARRRLAFPDKEMITIKISKNDYLAQAHLALQLLDEVSHELQVQKIEPAQAFYDPETSNFYANNFEKIYYRDDNHLSVTGAIQIAPLIALKAFGVQAEV